MKVERIFISVLTVGLLLALIVGLTAAQGPEPASNPDVAGPPPATQLVGTAFTYQGRLLHDGVPVNGTCDFEFRLFPVASGGSQVGDMVPVTTNVNGGLFTAQLDFGSTAFRGEARWLEISVTCPDTGPSGVLSPRRRLRPAPYALSLRPGAVISDTNSRVRLNRSWTTGGPPTELSHKAGVYGEAGGATFTYGLYGEGMTYGVFGLSGEGAPGLPTFGVFGKSPATSGRGVYGWAQASSGPAYGVYGISDSPEGAGVYALAAGEHDPDLILGGRSDSNDNGVIFSDPAFASSDIFIRSNDEVGIHLNRNGDADAGHLYVYNGDASVIFRLDEQGGVLVKDDEGQEMFNLSKTGGAQFSVGGAGMRVNTVPMINRAEPPADNMVTTLDTGDRSGWYSSITVGADGLGLISYSTLDGLKVAHCDDVACTSATITTLGLGRQPELTLGADGLGLICYKDLTDLDLKVAHCNDVACTDPTIRTLDSTGDVGGSCSITIGTDGLRLISYADASNEALKVAHCADVACTHADDINTLDSGLGTPYTRSSITVGFDGRGLISYDGYSDALRVAHCDDLNCSSADVITVLDSGAGGGSSITIGVDGLGLIAYHDIDGLTQHVKMAHCNDVACTDFSSHRVTTMTPGGNLTLTIGPDGLGMIVYHGGALYLARCTDLACNSVVTRYLYPAMRYGLHGGEISITMGADGRPLISYFYKRSGGDPLDPDELRVGHCAGPLCVPYFRRR